MRTVVYHVDDLTKAKEWYADLLGVEPYFDEPFYVGFNVGGYELGLDPDAPRPYRTLGYPVVPALFILVAAWLVINTIRTSPVESAAGLALIALGVPFYFYFKRRRTIIPTE
jgi:catechol 2,3-dioxygenase-like lactoylglutathione lyase family enzyme